MITRPLRWFKGAGLFIVQARDHLVGNGFHHGEFFLTWMGRSGNAEYGIRIRKTSFEFVEAVIDLFEARENGRKIAALLFSFKQFGNAFS